MELKIKDFKNIYFNHRANILCYINIGFSFFEVIAVYYIGTPVWFICVIFLRLIMSGFLFYCHKQRNAKKCQIWCLYEACMIVLIMTLALSKLVKLSNFGIFVAFLSFIFKMYSLWVVYYFSLEVQNDISVYFRQNTQVQVQNANAISSKSAVMPEEPSNLLERSQNPKNEEKKNNADAGEDSPVQYSEIYL